MRLAIIGAKGQVGQEFGKFLDEDQMIPLDIEDLDVRDPASVGRCLKELQFDVLVNLAAFHNVNECESHPAVAFGVNAAGAKNVASAAKEMGKKVVFFSSDYVFGGEQGRSSPYVETDRPAPLNVYGASKVAGEHLVRAVLPERHLIVRSSSLFGCVTSKKGWTFPELMLGKARVGEDIRVVNDQFMAPTYTHDLVHRVLELIGKNASGTYHVANGGSCSWYEFALATFESAGVEANTTPISSAEFPAKSRRPSYSVLASARLGELGLPPLRHWREALKAYLVEKGEVA
jgi:dTDP-4-dehydrorhamnose reductase